MVFKISGNQKKPQHIVMAVAKLNNTVTYVYTWTDISLYLYIIRFVFPTNIISTGVSQW
jgi:hypothetical protein